MARRPPARAESHESSSEEETSSRQIQNSRPESESVEKEIDDAAEKIQLDEKEIDDVAEGNSESGSESEDGEEDDNADGKTPLNKSGTAQKSPSSEEEESETDSEAKEVNSGEKPPLRQSASEKVSSDDNEDQEETETDSEEDEQVNLQKKSVIAPKSSSTYKDSGSGSRTAAKTPISKRPRDIKTTSDGGSKKRAKTENGEVSGKQLFRRVFTEEDDIAILEGLIEYCKPKVKFDINVFHDMIKNSLHCGVSKSQLSGKVQKLKNKYKNRMLLQSHNEKVFELSKKVWGGAGNSDADAKADSENNFMLDFHQFDGHMKKVEELITGDASKTVPKPKKSEMQREWDRLRKEQFEVYVKQMGLIYKRAKLVVQSMN